MARVVLATLVLVAIGLVGRPINGGAGSYGHWGLIVIGALAVSAILPHYFWRGEPLFPDRRRDRRRPPA